MAAASEPASDSSKPSVDEIIERIGFGWAQLRVGLLGGSVWLADGAELLLVGTVTRAVAEEWHMSAWQRGSVVSVVFVGILLGNCIAGPLGDQMGRRLPILVSYAGIALFSFASAHTNSYYQLAFVRLFVGASFGIGQPVMNALSTEVSPAGWRIVMVTLAQSLFVVGELFSAALVWYDDPTMQDLDWRWLLTMGALPSVVFFFLSYLFLHQSPSYLAVNGQYDEAKAVLESFAADNGKQNLCCEFRMPPPIPPRTGAQAAVDNMWVIFSRRLAYSTIAIMYSCFTLNVTYYGCLYAFPQVVTEVSLGPSPAVALMIGALWELPGMVIGAVVGMYFPRKPVIAGYLTATFLSLAAFGMGATAVKGGSDHWLDEALVQGGYIGIKMCASVGFISVYQYSTEIFPTKVRTTGTATCVAGGRVGGIVAPLVFERIAATGNIATFFYFIAVLCLINLVLVFFLPFETFGKSLAESDGEILPLAQHKAAATA